MSTRSNLMVVAGQAFGPEVFVADADVVLGDACGVVATGRPSQLLRAVDAGTAIAFMSEQAFNELGWMSAKAARGQGVDHEALRSVITRAYLPRIPVVSTGSPTDEHWMPKASDVTDPDDVSHAQLARLISARAVYSHDRHLRRPGFAPATRVEYEQRLVHLSVLTGRREAEHGIGLAVGVVWAGTTETLTWASARLNLKPTAIRLGVALAFAATGYFMFAPSERRRRIAAGLEPAIYRLRTALERSETARLQLGRMNLITTPNSEHLEVQVASHLARHPDATMGDIAGALGLSAARRRELAALLRSHPSFRLASQYGWAVGDTRPRLVTQPSSSWLPPSLPI